MVLSSIKLLLNLLPIEESKGEKKWQLKNNSSKTRL